MGARQFPVWGLFGTIQAPVAQSSEHSGSSFARPRVFARLALLGALGAGGALGACGGGSLSGPTTFEFRGLTPQDANAIDALLRENELRVVRKDAGGGTTFQTSDITSGKQMGSINRQILDMARRQGIETNYQGATFSYSSLSASGSAFTTVTIAASPGATAYLADQDGKNPWRLIRLDGSGRWQGAVRTRGRVGEEGGWLFAAFTRDGKLFRYLRVNVLTGEQQSATYAQAQRASLSEPTAGTSTGSEPGAPDVGARSSAEKAPGGSGGFKWPWEK